MVVFNLLIDNVEGCYVLQHSDHAFLAHVLSLLLLYHYYFLAVLFLKVRLIQDYLKVS